MKQPPIGILAGMGPRSTAPFYEDRSIDHAALEAAIREGLQVVDASQCLAREIVRQWLIRRRG